MEALRQLALAGFPSLGRTLRQVPHTADEALPLRRRDNAARVQQVEDVARLKRLLVCRQRQWLLQAEQPLADLLAVREPAL